MNKNFEVMLDLENKVKELIGELENLKNKSELYDNAKNELSNIQDTLKNFINLFESLRIAKANQTESLDSSTKAITGFKTELDKIDDLMKKSVDTNSQTINSSTQEFQKIQQNTTNSINDNDQQTKDLKKEIELISSELIKINKNFNNTKITILISILGTSIVGILVVLILIT